MKTKSIILSLIILFLDLTVIGYMLNSSIFIESDIKEAEALFKKVQYSPRQRKLLTELASVNS